MFITLKTSFAFLNRDTELVNVDNLNVNIVD